MLDRRSFLRAAAGGSAVALLSPAMLEALTTPPPPLPPEPLFQQDEEMYWTQVRQQFLIPPDEVYLNNGTVGSCPRPVLQAVFKGYEDTEKMDFADPEDYPIWGYGPWNEFRDPLAEFVGCSRDEIALLRNSTEANSYIANGVDMKAGDEVLMTNEEHPSGVSPWQLRAKRYGIVVKEFPLPRPAKSAAEILNRVHDAITPRTRVIFISHITTVTGIVLPVKEICALARSKNILTAIDGAHTTGMMKLNIRELGCDMFASSPHKWLQAPKGSGYLYIRDEVQDRVWNTIATAGWDDPKLKAERFQRIGSSNVPALHGLRAAIQFARLLGIERIERRHRRMADYILTEMTRRGAESWTSPDPALRCAIATVNVPPLQRMELETWLWKNRKILIRGGEPSKLRLSTPYYLLKAEIDRFLAAFDEFKRMKAAA